MTSYNGSNARVNVAAAIAAVLISASSLITVVTSTIPLQTAARSAPTAAQLPLA